MLPAIQMEGRSAAQPFRPAKRRGGLGGIGDGASEPEAVRASTAVGEGRADPREAMTETDYPALAILAASGGQGASADAGDSQAEGTRFVTAQRYTDRAEGRVVGVSQTLRRLKSTECLPGKVGRSLSPTAGKGDLRPLIEAI